MYDGKIGRWLSVDPKHVGFSPYEGMGNNPVTLNDPDGGDPGEYERDENGNWKKTSTLGDDIGVDFYHTDFTDKNEKEQQLTYITDRQGNWNSIKNGRSVLEGQSRDKNVNWNTILDEWVGGYGPEKSIFEGNHPANSGIQKNYLFQKANYKFQNSGLTKQGLTKQGLTVDFGLTDILLTEGGDGFMQVQMMGSYNVSFYKLGDRTLALLQDSKSRTSFYYHIPLIENYARDEKFFINADGSFTYDNRKANTYQTYLFFAR